MNEMSTNWDQRADEAIDALLNGPGYYLAESVFSAEQVAEANRIINAHSDEAQAATHFHGEHADKIHLQRRVWNLLNKGQVFVGIDVIGDYLTEINVTSPTGIQELERFDGINVAEKIWQAIEAKLA